MNAAEPIAIFPIVVVNRGPIYAGEIVYNATPKAIGITAKTIPVALPCAVSVVISRRRRTRSIIVDDNNGSVICFRYIYIDLICISFTVNFDINGFAGLAIQPLYRYICIP